MLKIKQNVDLKELEKYGFEYNRQNNTYVRTFSHVFFYREIEIYIDNPNFKSGEIKAYSSIIQDFPKEDWIEKNIQDLIKADLVEKID
jgi:hypothetical protein